MTDQDDTMDAECVVVTDHSNPLRQDIAHLLQAIGASRTPACEISFDEQFMAEFLGLDANDKPRPVIANEAGESTSQNFFDHFVQRLIQAHIAIIDMTHGAKSTYVLAIRQSLSNGITIALSKGQPELDFAGTRFTIPPFPIIDVNDANWLGSALAHIPDDDAKVMKGWQNDLHASRTYRVAPEEIKLASILPPAELKTYQYCPDETAASATGPKIMIWEGAIQDAKEFSVWVNSENTHMEMARFWDKSVSAQIRKLGAVKRGSLKSNRRKDALGLALAEAIGTRTVVDIGTVFMTPTDPKSDLHQRNYVRHVAHVAAVIPDEERGGFESGGHIGKCLSRVFDAIKSTKDKKSDLKSVLIPLIGSGDGGAHASLIAHKMVVNLKQLILGEDHKDFLDEDTEIGLIAYFQSHRSYLQRELKNAGFVWLNRPEEP